MCIHVLVNVFCYRHLLSGSSNWAYSLPKVLTV
jgi:hypothetical protein